jgi:DNA polymerase I
LDVLPEFVVACGFADAKAPGYEGDDFLAPADAEETRRKGHALVASGDRDAFQLASDNVTILHPVKAGPDEVRERYGVEPSQVPDFIALRGDPSDKLPGAKGVGAKGAAGLLSKYATLEDAIGDGRFLLQASELRLYRRIAAMDARAPLPLLDDQTPNWGSAATLVRSWEPNHLADQLEEYAEAGTQID